MCMTADPMVQGGGETVLHRVEARIKVVAMVTFVILTAGMSATPYLLAALGIIGLLAVIARMPVRLLAGRLALVVPFSVLMLVVLPFTVPGEGVALAELGPLALVATREGLLQAQVLALRLANGVLAASILTFLTPFPVLMNALRGLRVPPILVTLMEFTVRYLFVLADEARRMQLSRQARDFRPRGFLWHSWTMSTLAQMVGVLFIRSYTRADRVYQAMLARGFSGHQPVRAGARVKASDLCWGIGITAAALTLRMMEVGGGMWLQLLK